jgi:hypothetical protein
MHGDFTILKDPIFWGVMLLVVLPMAMTGAAALDRVGAERVVDREQERQANQQQDVEDRRCDQNRFEYLAPVQDEMKA